MKEFISESLKALRPEYLHLLCYLAFAGEDNYATPKADSLYRQRFDINKDDYNSLVYNLRREHYLVNSTSIDQALYLQILALLLSEHNDWLTAFRSMKVSRTQTAVYLEYIADCFLHDDFQRAAAKPRPYEGFCPQAVNLYSYLRDLALRDIRYLYVLKREEIQPAVSALLREQLELEQLDLETIEQIRSTVPSKAENYANLMSELDAYCYFISGKEPYEPKNRSTNAWWICTKAISHLYHGNITDSLSWFTSLTRLRKSAVWKSPIVCLYYSFALLRANQVQGDSHLTERINNFRFKDPCMRSTSNNFFAHLLFEHQYESEDMQLTIGNAISAALNENDSPLMRRFAWLAAHYFGFELDDTRVPDSLSPIMLIKHEQCSYYRISDTSKKDLVDVFGGEPILPKLRVRKAWESLLDELSLPVVESPQRQIIYCFEKDALSAIIEQSQHADGSWHDEQLLSLSMLIKSGNDSMSPEDYMAISALSTKDDSLSDIQAILPYVASSGRIFEGNSFQAERTPIEVIHEKPFLHFHAQGSMINIESNVKLREANIDKFHVRSMGNNTYSMVTTGPLQRDILKKFLTQKSLPTTAGGPLLRALKSIEDIIDIEENVSKAVNNSIPFSEGLLAVRICPHKNDYIISILSAPLRDGSVRLSVSNKTSFVYDEVNGVTCCVNRNLAAEENNYKLLEDFLTNTIHVEWDGTEQCLVSSIESLLSLITFIHDHEASCFVEWPEGHTIRIINPPLSSSIEVSVRSSPKWFELNGTLTTPVGIYDLEQLISSYANKPLGDYVRLSEDEYLHLTADLKKQIQLLNTLIPIKKDKRIPFYHVGALSSLLEEIEHSVDEQFEKILERTREIFESTVPIPSGLNAQLRPYQKEGFQWMCRMDNWGAGICLADDMGLGKTIQALTFLLSRAERGPSLVVCPKSVIMNWNKEMRHFTPSLSPIILNEESNRATCLASLKSRDVVLCTYGVLCTESFRISKIEWNVACLDEAHQIKNRNTLASDAAMHLNAKSRIVLTGTPIQNHVGELWNLFQFMNPGMLGEWFSFKARWMHDNLRVHEVAMLREMTQPFILRRTKEEVLQDLPEKFVHIRMVTMTPEEKDIYEKMRSLAEIKFKKEKNIEERGLVKNIKMNYFEELTKLRLACCSMHLLEPSWHATSSKITAFLDVLDTLVANPNNKILVFSQYTRFLALIRPELEKRNIEFLYLDGQTTLKKRQEQIHKFQSGECQVFLSSLKAGGFGINLTAANYVVLLDPWWNPAIEQQAMDRAHRIGQKRPVTVVRLITEHSIEEKLLSFHEMKKNITDDMLHGTNETHKLTYDDIMDMVVPFE